MYSLTNYVNVAPLEDTSQWQNWGQILLHSPSLGLLSPPSPYDFTDWKQWAARLADALSSATGADNAGSIVPPGFAFLIDVNGDGLQTASGQTIIIATAAPNA